MKRRRRRSKRPSAASSIGKLRSSSVFYLDESIYSRILAEALTAAGVNVRRPGRDVPFGTPDEDWLTLAGQNGWITLLRDKRVRHREVERTAIVEAKVAAFIFTGGQVSADGTTQTLLRLLDKMINIAMSEPRPFLYTITASGTLGRTRLSKT